jgi:hypothetical protein
VGAKKERRATISTTSLDHWNGHMCRKEPTEKPWEDWRKVVCVCTFNLLEQLLHLVPTPVTVYVHPQDMGLQEASKQSQTRTVESSLTNLHTAEIKQSAERVKEG